MTLLGTAENRTSFSHGPFDDNCAKRFFFGQYPFAMRPNSEYFVQATATLPKKYRFTFGSASQDDAVLMKIFMEKPMKIEVFVSDVKVETSQIMPTMSSPAVSI